MTDPLKQREAAIHAQAQFRSIQEAVLMRALRATFKFWDSGAPGFGPSDAEKTRFPTRPE